MKLGIDRGRKRLLSSMSLLDNEVLLEEPKQKRRKFSDGISGLKQFRSSGVKKLLVLAVVPEGKEDYEVVRKFVEWINLEPGSFSFCVDLKMTNVAIGCMPHIETSLPVLPLSVWELDFLNGFENISRHSSFQRQMDRLWRRFEQFEIILQLSFRSN
jgi:hypothetical protein